MQTENKNAVADSYCSHGTRSLKLRRGVPQLQENSFAVARRDPLDFAGRGAVQ